MRKKWFIENTAEPIENQMVNGITIARGGENTMVRYIQRVSYIIGCYWTS